MFISPFRKRGRKRNGLHQDMRSNRNAPGKISDFYYSSAFGDPAIKCFAPFLSFSQSLSTVCVEHISQSSTHLT